MKIKKMRNNKVCDPKMPNDAQDKATRFVEALLQGIYINRKTAHELGICPENDSLHSTASILRNIRFIPVESKRTADGTSDYYMEPEEIIRYLDPALREQQKEEMRLLVSQKRINRITDNFSKLLDWLSEFPKLWQCVENLPVKLNEILKRINALLNNKEQEKR